MKHLFAKILKLKFYKYQNIIEIALLKKDNIKCIIIYNKFLI